MQVGSDLSLLVEEELLNGFLGESIHGKFPSNSAKSLAIMGKELDFASKNISKQNHSEKTQFNSKKVGVSPSLDSRPRASSNTKRIPVSIDTTTKRQIPTVSPSPRLESIILEQALSLSPGTELATVMERQLSLRSLREKENKERIASSSDVSASSIGDDGTVKDSVITPKVAPVIDANSSSFPSKQPFVAPNMSDIIVHVHDRPGKVIKMVSFLPLGVEMSPKLSLGACRDCIKTGMPPDFANVSVTAKSKVSCDDSAEYTNAVKAAKSIRARLKQATMDLDFVFVSSSGVEIPKWDEPSLPASMHAVETRVLVEEDSSSQSNSIVTKVRYHLRIVLRSGAKIEDKDFQKSKTNAKTNRRVLTSNTNKEAAKVAAAASSATLSSFQKSKNKTEYSNENENEKASDAFKFQRYAENRKRSVSGTREDMNSVPSVRNLLSGGRSRSGRRLSKSSTSESIIT